MRRFLTILTCWAAAFVTSFPVAALEVTGLYEAEVPVTSQDAIERAAASRAAMMEVLIKVSGSAEVLQRPELKPLLDQAEQWVQRYQYRAAPPSLVAADQSAAPTQILWVAFDRQTINQRLAEAGLPVWGLNRPRTLVWLAVEDGGKRYLVGGDNRPDLQQMIGDQARRRGLPLNLPLLDLQDQRSLAVADVWGDFSDAVFKASERYQADAVLVGRLYTVPPDKWQSHWTLYHRGTMSSWESAPGLQNEAVAAGVAGAAEQFAKRYALSLTAEAGNSVTLTIENVASLTDYARALKYLQSLDPVASVQVARVDGAAISYRLKVRGQAQDLTRTIGWGRTLIAADQSDTEPGETAVPENEGVGNPAAGEYRYRMAP